MLAVACSWDALQFASREIRGDREVVFAAIAYRGQALEFATWELRGDPDVALAAVRRDAEGLQCAAEHLRRDAAFVLEAISANSQAMRFLEVELRSDIDFAMAAVQVHADALQYLSMELREDRRVVLAAVQVDGYALEHASEALQRDRCVVLAAVREDGMALEFAAPKLRKDWYIVLTAVERNAAALVFADWELRVDRTFILEAAKVNGRILEFAHFEELQCDMEIVGASMEQLLANLSRKRGPELEFSLASLVFLAPYGCAQQLVLEHEALLRCLTVNSFEHRTRSAILMLFEQLSQYAGAMLFHVAQCASVGDNGDAGGWLRYASVDILELWFMKDRRPFCSSAGQRAAIILAIGLQEKLENRLGVESREKTAALLDEVMEFIREEAPELLDGDWGPSKRSLADVSMMDARILLHAWFFCQGQGAGVPSPMAAVVTA